MIAGIGKNNELGKKNQLLWNMPADMAHFKEKTSGHSVLMGQRTFESIGRPLPKRRNVVLTRDTNFKAEGIEIAYSFEEAFNLFKNSDEEIFIIGGAEIYKQGMAFADKLYITEVDMEDKDADTFFPEIIPIVFGETTRENHKKDDKNPYNYSFVEYERI